MLLHVVTTEQSQAIGVANGGVVYATADYNATGTDELSFRETDQLRVVRKGDDSELEWWWAKSVGQATTRQGYVPRNYLSVRLIDISFSISCW